MRNARVESGVSLLLALHSSQTGNEHPTRRSSSLEALSSMTSPHQVTTTPTDAQKIEAAIRLTQTAYEQATTATSRKELGMTLGLLLHAMSTEYRVELASAIMNDDAEKVKAMREGFVSLLRGGRWRRPVDMA